MYVADLHIHSKYSRATSKDCDLQHLDLWARRKGIHLVGTGDFTHPAWRESLKNELLPAEPGFFRLRDELRLPCETQAESPRFVLSGEISCIYKKAGKTRKVHSVILLPDLDAAERLSLRLEAIGNIRSDGRPILGLDCHDLLEITLEACPDAIFIPAHIWTPHFSLFGAFSGFDAIEECFGDLTNHIHALETGLSSDPAMNYRVSALDGYQLVSNSDAHSPFLFCPATGPEYRRGTLWHTGIFSGGRQIPSGRPSRMRSMPGTRRNQAFQWHLPGLRQENYHRRAQSGGGVGRSGERYSRAQCQTL